MKHIYLSVLACALLVAQVRHASAAPIVDNSQLPGSVTVTWTSSDLDLNGSYLFNISNGDASKSAQIVVSRFGLFAKATDITNPDLQVQWTYGNSIDQPTYTSGQPVAPSFPLVTNPLIAGFASYSLVITDVDGAPGTWTAKLIFSDPQLTARQMVAAALLQVNNLIVGVTDSTDLSKLKAASKALTMALVATLWTTDETLSLRDGSKALDDIKNAATQFEALLKDQGCTLSDASMQEILGNLVAVDKMLAETAIAMATNPNSIIQANKELATGNACLAAGKVNEAIDHYRNAWAQAIKV